MSGWEVVINDAAWRRWVDRDHPGGDRQTKVEAWLQGFFDGPGFADGVPGTMPDLFAARVKNDPVVIVTYLRRMPIQTIFILEIETRIPRDPDD